MTPMAARPAEIATRAVSGHWEGDLVARITRLVLLARMDGTDARGARAGFTKTLRHVPALLRKTLTYDRGKEMSEHARLAKRLAIQIFFLPIRTAPGNVAPTRTRMDCCANTCPRVPTCRATRSAS